MSTLRNHPGFWLRDDAAAAFDQAEADHGVFRVNSAGRTEAQQQALINRWNRGGAANRPPNLYEPKQPARASNHVANGGIAVDLGDWRRFAPIAARYGFSHPYPQSDPVHFEKTGAFGGSVTSSETIRNQMTWLIQRGYDLGPSGADGIPGDFYRAAVTKYQNFLRSYGYTGESDGKWGDGTQAAHQRYYDSVKNFNQELKNQQAFLISRGYDLGTSGADGLPGPSTEKAFKIYQNFLRAYGYAGEIDGIWGPGMQTAHQKYHDELNAPPKPTGNPTFPLPTTQWFGPEAGGDNSVSGWHSTPVGHPGLKQFQQKMKDRGWPMQVDGLYGPKGASTPQGNTAEVVVAFQKEKGLTPDGLIGMATWDAAWNTPITTAPPIPAEPEPTVPVVPPTATPNLITPTYGDFPSWIKFEVVYDPEFAVPGYNKKYDEYYGVPYAPVESHWHWWGAPGKAGTHDGNVNHLKNTKELSVNFVASENRITLMTPLDYNALTTGRRNPYGWKVENDPTLTDQQYKTMGYLLYIVEKLNPSLLNKPLRLHKEFQSTSCSEVDRSKVRDYAEKFRTGKLDPKTGKAPTVTPPVVDPPVINPPIDPVPEIPSDSVLVKKAYLKGLATELRSLAGEFDELAK